LLEKPFFTPTFCLSRNRHISLVYSISFSGPFVCHCLIFKVLCSLSPPFCCSRFSQAPDSYFSTPACRCQALFCFFLNFTAAVSFVPARSQALSSTFPACLPL